MSTPITNVSDVTNGLFCLKIDSRGMRVSLAPGSARPFSAPQAEDVFRELTVRKVVVGDADRGRIEQTIRDWKAQGASAAEAVVITGTPPREGQDGQLVWSAQCAPDSAGGGGGGKDNFSHYASRLRLITVAAGGVIATIQPPTDGAPGRDIFGQGVPARRGQPCKVVARKGCHLDEASATVVADVAGTLEVHGEDICVDEVLHIKGSVDFETGNVETAGEVQVVGNVADLFQVIAGGDITIGGSIDNAMVRSAGNLVIKGVLANHRSALALAGKDMLVRLCENSVAAACGSIQITREAMNCDLFAGGSIECLSGSLCGGLIVARGGLKSKTLGSGGNVRTVAMAGVDWLLAQASRPLREQAAKRQEQIQKSMPTLDILRANCKRLTASQKEQVTELEFQMQDIVDRNDALVSELAEKERLSEQACKPSISVSRIVHPGTEICLGKHFALVERPIRGPVTFTVIDVAGEKTVVASSPGGRGSTLSTGKRTDPLEKVRIPELPPEFVKKFFTAAP